MPILLSNPNSPFLGPSPSNEQLSAWFNACLNSACGPIEGRYGHVTVAGLLMMWFETAKRKADGQVAN